MSVKPIIPSIDSNINANNVKNNNSTKGKNVSFGGTNFIVDTMNFIEKGGYPVAFTLQDGLGFIMPRVGEGLVRGSEKKDENGNPILDAKGKPVREYNWALAKKEFLREIITGPSAFVIPWLALKGINKYASGNNVKLNYIDGFNNAFTEFAKSNTEAIKSGTAPKKDFYSKVFENVIENSINSELPDAEEMTKEEIKNHASKFAENQVKIEEITSSKSLNKEAKAKQIADLNGSAEELFMKLKKNKIGGAVNEMAITISSTDGTKKGGSIGELLSALKHYYGDAVKSTKKALENNADTNISELVKSFTNRRMGTRIFTNLGLFGVVAAFYTQIPKLYNMGLKGNPALKGTVAEGSQTKKQQKKSPDTKSKEVAFTGLGGIYEKVGKGVFNNKLTKSVSDVFELNGPSLSNVAMPVLLYGFCIPPRLAHAQDKYDYGEVVLRDMTSFTALLFGSNALGRLFSDLLTKKTGLALNMKNLEGRNILQKIGDYLDPREKRHVVLSSKQLNSKYMNLQDYKDGVNGFVEFIEKSNGNIKKALSLDKNVRACTDKILKEFNGKTFSEATAEEIKAALKEANKAKTPLMKEFYELFKSENGLLKAAKTCNSSFKFLSSFVLVPSLIIWLTHACKKMTERRTAHDVALQEKQHQPAQGINLVASNAPTMAGFLNNK